MHIQKLRLQHGWSQQQLADLSGLSVRTIQRIERGQPASTESLKSLGAVFEIDFSSLQPESSTMNTNLTQGISPDEALAFQHVRRLRGFYIHLMQYLIVISLLTTLNLAQIYFLQIPRMPFWVQWVALGWGAGLISHAAIAFNLLPFFGAEWEKRQIEKRLGRTL